MESTHDVMVADLHSQAFGLLGRVDARGDEGVARVAEYVFGEDLFAVFGVPDGGGGGVGPSSSTRVSVVAASPSSSVVAAAPSREHAAAPPRRSGASSKRKASTAADVAAVVAGSHADVVHLPPVRAPSDTEDERGGAGGASAPAVSAKFVVSGEPITTPSSATVTEVAVCDVNTATLVVAAEAGAVGGIDDEGGAAAAATSVASAAPAGAADDSGTALALIPVGSPPREGAAGASAGGVLDGTARSLMVLGSPDASELAESQLQRRRRKRKEAQDRRASSAAAHAKSSHASAEPDAHVSSDRLESERTIAHASAVASARVRGGARRARSARCTVCARAWTVCAGDCRRLCAEGHDKVPGRSRQRGRAGRSWMSHE